MHIFLPGILLNLVNLTYISCSSVFGTDILGIKVGRSKPGVVLTSGFNWLSAPVNTSELVNTGRLVAD